MKKLILLVLVAVASLWFAPTPQVANADLTLSQVVTKSTKTFRPPTQNRGSWFCEAVL